MMTRVLVLLHIAAAVVFLGNIVAGLFWASRAAGSRDSRILRHTFASLSLSDLVFTMPCVLLISATGVVAAVRTGLPLLRTGWIFWSIVLFSLSGVAFLFRVLPLQNRLARFAEEDGTAAPPLVKAWSAWAHTSLALVTLALILMVLKPALPALGK